MNIKVLFLLVLLGIVASQSMDSTVSALALFYSDEYCTQQIGSAELPAGSCVILSGAQSTGAAMKTNVTTTINYYSDTTDCTGNSIVLDSTANVCYYNGSGSGFIAVQIGVIALLLISFFLF
ncbi:hypothetical protein M0811_13588 [Anaeramoeba ignava]|uniref:Transmembrane protein n=1 Tax=Anaeramoeba ignava TaxID=1746090 RepID=A0A9Q0L627_ANAIG|nr:hypothetical protein M0811_13588 [Anaeramoeba ignava]